MLAAISSKQGILQSCPSEFIKIRQILRSSGGDLGLDQVGLSKVANWKISFLGNHPVAPSFLKIQARDGGEEINLARGNPEIELSPGSRKVLLRHPSHGNAKFVKRVHQPACIFQTWLKPHVQIFCVARLGMVDHRIATRYQISDLMLV